MKLTCICLIILRHFDYKITTTTTPRQEKFILANSNKRRNLLFKIVNNLSP